MATSLPAKPFIVIIPIISTLTSTFVSTVIAIMLNSFEECISFRHDPVTKRRVYEKVTGLYLCPSSHTQLHYTIGYKFNEIVPSAIENRFLATDETDLVETLDNKMKFLASLAASILRKSTKIWLTVTGIEIHTCADGTLGWNLFEDKEEMFNRLPVTSLPKEILKVDIGHFSSFQEVAPSVYKVRYQDEKYILKLNQDKGEATTFQLEAAAKFKAGNLPHVNKMIGVVVNNVYDIKEATVKGLLLEYCSRGDLKTLLQYSEPPIDSTTKLRWAAQIAHGIQALHEKGLIHSDLRCQNVVIDDDDDAQIIDCSGEGGYTRGWHAYLDKMTDPRQDIYSFGVTLWEIIHDGEDPPCISASLPIDWRGKKYNDAVIGLIEECTSEYADQRASMSRVLEVLNADRICGCHPEGDED